MAEVEVVKLDGVGVPVVITRHEGGVLILHLWAELLETLGAEALEDEGSVSICQRDITLEDVSRRMQGIDLKMTMDKANRQLTRIQSLMRQLDAGLEKKNDKEEEVPRP